MNSKYVCQQNRGLQRKFLAVKNFGGKCSSCGYNKNLSALEFHHLEPESKSFGVSLRQFSNCSLKELEKELSKCILLCANCHREIHYPQFNRDNVNSFINIDKKPYIKNFGRECPVCGTRFLKSKGKIFCSKECRTASKCYPPIEKLKSKYLELKSWSAVADYFNITRKIIQTIRKHEDLKNN